MTPPRKPDFTSPAYEFGQPWGYLEPDNHWAAYAITVSSGAAPWCYVAKSGSELLDRRRAELVRRAPALLNAGRRVLAAAEREGWTGRELDSLRGIVTTTERFGLALEEEPDHAPEEALSK